MIELLIKAWRSICFCKGPSSNLNFTTSPAIDSALTLPVVKYMQALRLEERDPVHSTGKFSKHLAFCSEGVIG